METRSDEMVTLQLESPLTTAERPTLPGPRTQGIHFPRGAWWLVAASVAMVVVSMASHYLLYRQANVPESLRVLWYLFDVGREYNIATWLNSGLWVTLGVVAGLGALLTTRTWSWSLFALVAVLASIDEFAEVHERLDTIGNAIAGRLGIELWFTWVLAAIPIVIMVIAMLAPLALAMPRGQALLLVLGGALFLTGAVGIESLSGVVLAASGGVPDATFVWVTAIEELFEMVGIAVAIGAVAGLYTWTRREGRLDVHFRGWHRKHRGGDYAEGGP